MGVVDAVVVGDGTGAGGAGAGAEAMVEVVSAWLLTTIVAASNVVSDVNPLGIPRLFYLNCKEMKYGRTGKRVRRGFLLGMDGYFWIKNRGITNRIQNPYC